MRRAGRWFRFILSLRAVGEGHISSLTFRSGMIGADGSVAVDPTARLASVPEVESRTSRANGEVVDVAFPRAEDDLSERVIFRSPTSSNGIEDAASSHRRRTNNLLRHLHRLHSGRRSAQSCSKRRIWIVRMAPLAGRPRAWPCSLARLTAAMPMIARQDNETCISSIPTDISTRGMAAILQPEYPWESYRLAVVDHRSVGRLSAAAHARGGPVRKYSK